METYKPHVEGVWLMVAYQTSEEMHGYKRYVHTLPTFSHNILIDKNEFST